MLCLMAVFFGSNVLADEITFTAGTDKGTKIADNAGEDAVTKDGITIATNNGCFATDQYRVYKNATFTVTSTVGTITSIKVTCTANGTAKQGPGCLENPSTGAYEFEAAGKTGSWTGSAEEVSFTCPSNQCRMTEVVVTVGEADPNAVAAPTISGDTQFEESTTVTITATDAEAALFYTTDGTDPTTSGIAYTAPFTLTETATVKAAAKKGDKWSNVVSKEFTKITTTAAANIAAFNAMANGTENVVLTLTNAKVLACNATTFIINDGTAGTELYGVTLEAKQGDVLNGTVTGKRVDYNGITEMSDITENTITVTDGTANATTATVAEVADADIFGAFYRLENVQVVKDGNNFFMKDGDTQMQVYNSLHISGITFAEGQFNIEGVVGAYKTTKQFIPTLFEAYTDPSDVPVPTISGDETFTEQTTVTITSTIEGGAIYYTLDGTDPASSGTRLNYTEPFTITETTTVTACAEDGDGNLSNAVSKTFTKATTTTAADIAAFLQIADKTTGVVLTLTNAQVLAKGGNYTIVADATAGVEFFKVTTPELKAGDMLNGTITGTKDTFNGVPELTSVTANTLTITEGTLTATTADVATVAAAPIFAKLFKLENVEVSSISGKNATISDGTNTMALYNQFGSVTLDEGNFNIEGVVGIYNENIQFWPTKMEKNLGNKQDPALAFAEETCNATLGEAFTAPALTNTLNVAVTWTSSNEAVATVDANGNVTLVGAGTTTITAASEENEQFVASQASYKLNVNDPAWESMGTETSPFTVTALLAMPTPENSNAAEGQEKKWVVGYIVGAVKNNALDNTVNTCIALAASADETDFANCVPVQLPNNTDVRANLNVVDNPDNIGKQVMVYGHILKYFNVTGVKNTTDYRMVTDGINTVATKTATNNAPAYNMAGQRVAAGYKGIVIKNGKKVVVK